MTDRIANLEAAVSYLSERVLGEAFSVPDLAARNDTEAEDRLQGVIARVDALAEMVMRPQVISDGSQTDFTPVIEEIERVKNQHLELLRLVQKLAKDADETAAKVKALEPLARLEVNSELMKIIFKVGGTHAA